VCASGVTPGSWDQSTAALADHDHDVAATDPTQAELDLRVELAIDPRLQAERRQRVEAALVERAYNRHAVACADRFADDPVGRRCQLRRRSDGRSHLCRDADALAAAADVEVRAVGRDVVLDRRDGIARVEARPRLMNVGEVAGAGPEVAAVLGADAPLRGDRGAEARRRRGPRVPTHDRRRVPTDGGARAVTAAHRGSCAHAQALEDRGARVRRRVVDDGAGRHLEDIGLRQRAELPADLAVDRGSLAADRVLGDRQPRIAG
jgi:hypothetical protein